MNNSIETLKAQQLFNEAADTAARFKIEYRLEHENFNNTKLINLYWKMSERLTRRWNTYQILKESKWEIIPKFEDHNDLKIAG